MRTLQEIGQELKEYRIKNNIDINLIMKNMKSSKNTIYLLESGDYKVSNVKARLIYKKYIENLGLDYKEYDEDIKRIFPNVVEETINLSNEAMLEEFKFKKNFKLNKGILSMIIIIIFLMILIPLTVYNFNNKVVDDVENTTTLIKNTTLEPKKIIEPKIKELKVKRSSINQIDVYLEDLSKVNVKIVAGDVTYYDYEENNVIKEQGTLQKGDEKEFVLNDATNMRINIGNIVGTKIYVNEFEITQKLENVGTQNYITFKKEG